MSADQTPVPAPPPGPGWKERIASLADVGTVMKIVVVAVLGALIFWIASVRIFNVAIVVKTVVVPPKLAPLSASELTHRLADAIDSVKYDARPSPDQRRYAIDADMQVPDVEVPMTQTNLPKLIALVRNALGRDAYEVTWEISGYPNAPKEQWVVTAYLPGHASHQAPFDPTNPGPAISAIAQGVLGDIEPLILARALLYDGKCGDALAVAQRLLRRQAVAGQDQGAALNFVGFASECGDPAWGTNTGEAMRYYRDAILHDSSNGLPHANLGRMFAIRAALAREAGDAVALAAYRDSMKREFAEAERLTSNHPGVHEAWGDSWLKAGSPDSALRHLDAAINLEPRLAPAYFARADARHQLSDFAGAVADYGRGILRAPNDTQHVKAYGHEQILTGDWRGAAGAFARAAQLDTTDYDTRYYLGCTLRHVHSPAAAAVLGTVISAMGPQSPYAIYARLAIASDTVSCL